ncbi:hypothetical protein OG216_16665 [Streptomycetaceae bacterium NBC_01309]
MGSRVLGAGRSVVVPATALLAGGALMWTVALVFAPVAHGEVRYAPSSGQTAGDDGTGSTPGAAQAAADGGRDATDTALIATAAGSALLAVGSMGMHVRARRALANKTRPQGLSLVSALVEAPARPDSPWSPAPWPPSTPAAAPAERVPVPPVTAPPPPAPRAATDTPPPNHNALDSVWSISAVLGEDPVDNTTAGFRAVPAEPREATGAVGPPGPDAAPGSPAPPPSWRPPPGS